MKNEKKKSGRMRKAREEKNTSYMAEKQSLVEILYIHKRQMEKKNGEQVKS